MGFLLGLLTGVVVSAIVFAVFHKQIANDLVEAENKVKTLEAKVLAFTKAKTDAVKKVF